LHFYFKKTQAVLNGISFFKPSATQKEAKCDEFLEIEIHFKIQSQIYFEISKICFFFSPEKPGNPGYGPLYSPLKGNNLFQGKDLSPGKGPLSRERTSLQGKDLSPGKGPLEGKDLSRERTSL